MSSRKVSDSAIQRQQLYPLRLTRSAIANGRRLATGTVGALCPRSRCRLLCTCLQLAESSRDSESSERVWTLRMHIATERGSALFRTTESLGCVDTNAGSAHRGSCDRVVDLRSLLTPWTHLCSGRVTMLELHAFGSPCELSVDDDYCNQSLLAQRKSSQLPCGSKTHVATDCSIYAS